MGSTVVLVFSNPHARILHESLRRLVIHLPDFPGSETPDCGTQISVSFDTGVTAVEASRSLYTSNEIYLVQNASDAALVVTDHFLSAIRHCRPDQRVPDDDAVVDHFLFRTVSGDKTYARGVSRLGHGRTVRWDPESSSVRLIRRETATRPRPVKFLDGVVRLEESLAKVMGSALTPGVSEYTPTNLLSGGVDSTLLQVFLGRLSHSTSAAIDTPEFEAETERALRSSELVGSRHSVVRLLETDYPQALERFIRMTGLPPHHMQSVLFAELFRLCEKERRYLVTAQFADALFGLDSLVRPAAVLRRWGWLPRLTSKTYLPQSIKPPRLRLAESWSSALAEPIASTRGVAARAACYTDFPFVERVFGAAAVMRRLARRLEYVLDVCPLIVPEKTSDPDAQIEAAHLVDYFCDDAVSIWRQSAMSHGGYLIAPFTHPDIIGSSLRFDRTERYYRGGEVKPALKTLLRRRLPVYDTGIPKLASGLPIRRFLDSGPLAHSDYFAPPEFFPRPPQLNRAAYPHWVAWGILTLSMWRALVTKDPFAPPVWLSRRYP